MPDPFTKAIGGEIMEEVLKPLFRTFAGDAANLARKGRKLNNIDTSFRTAFENGSLLKVTNEIQHKDAIRINRKIANNQEEYVKFKGVMSHAALNDDYFPLTGYLQGLETEEVVQAEQRAKRRNKPNYARQVSGSEGGPVFETPVDPIATGRANRMGTGGAVSNTDIANIGRTDHQARAAVQAKGESIYGPGAHHHIVDQKFAGQAYNTVDAEEVIQAQIELGGSRFGDNEYNIATQFDRKELPRDINFR